jgi:signal transduction histidine kinase
MLLLYSIAALFSGVLNSIFALLAYLRYKKGLPNRLFGLLCIAFAVWTYSYWIWLSFSYNDYSTALFWSRMLNLGATLIPPLYVHWIFSFLGFENKKRKLIIFGYLLTLIFLAFSFSPLYIKDVKQVLFFPFWPQAGIVYSIYIITSYLAYNSIAFYYLIKTYKVSDGFKKNQIKYLILGSIFGFGGGAFNFPLMYSVQLVHPIGMFFVPLNVILFAYASIKYRLMNIRLILTRSILYAVLVASVASFFALSVFFVGNVLGGTSQASKIITYVINSFIIVIFIEPLKNIFAKITDRIFYKDRIDYQKLLQQASAVVAKEIDLEKFSLALCNLLAEQLKIKQVSALITKKSEWHLIASSKNNNFRVKLSELFIKLLKDRHDFIIVEELIRSQNDLNSETPYYQELGSFIKEAEDLKVEMVVPVFGDNGQLTSIFLFSAKSSGELYGQDDINFLKILTPQIATAIEKSKLYEEVQALNVGLQAKVDSKTKSLKEANVGLEQRNKFLTAMQTVTNFISRTMDLKQVNQMIANSIALEFGYIGGILSFIDEKNNILRIGAITENEQSEQVIKILGQDPKNYEAEMKMRDLLGVKTVMSGQMNTSDKMSDFFSPPVEKAVMDQVQEKLGVKTIVGLPIFSEDKIIGIIHFLLDVEKEQVNSLDTDTMIALADQVGIVSRNLRLYNNLQATNQDLQIANMRLRELDQAKSEFLSIASHQLRTPISALKGYLSMISDGDFGAVPPKIGKVVKDLFESAARLARLVNIFLNVSRIESGRLKIEKKPLQIGDMIESVIAELHNESDKKGVKLIYKKPKPALPLVAADADKLREVVLNLIDNSIKYTPKGQIEVSAVVENENLHFIVKDTGIGIDPEEAKNLFRKFVRASGAAQIHTGGSGLGLFIAQKIIKEHGGKIWVESAGKEKGSTFQFVIALKGAEPNTEEMKA